MGGDQGHQRAQRRQFKSYPYSRQGVGHDSHGQTGLLQKGPPVVRRTPTHTKPFIRTSTISSKTNWHKPLGTSNHREDLVIPSTKNCILPVQFPLKLYDLSKIHESGIPSGPLSLVRDPTPLKCPRYWPISSVPCQSLII